jgi:hypothetical protein
MRKENFVIALIAVGAVAFFFGRLSVSTSKRSKSKTTATVAAKAKTADTAGDKSGAAGGAELPSAATAANKAAAPARVAGSLTVVASPSKGAAVAKVTIIEISDFQ